MPIINQTKNDTNFHFNSLTVLLNKGVTAGMSSNMEDVVASNSKNFIHYVRNSK